MTHYQTDKAINQAYPVDQHSPPIGHIEITAMSKEMQKKNTLFFNKNVNILHL